MTQVTYPDLADPASSKIFQIISITKYFEKYFKSTFEIFRNYFRNISKLKYFEIYFKIFRNILRYVKSFERFCSNTRSFERFRYYKFADEDDSNGTKISQIISQYSKI